MSTPPGDEELPRSAGAPDGPVTPAGAGDTPTAAEIEALEQEVDSLRRQLAEHPATPSKPRRRSRTFSSAVLIIVACLLAPLSIVAVWARGEVTDTDRYVATVAPLASDPTVQNAVATRITNEILTRIDIPALTNDVISAISANRSLTPRQTEALRLVAGPVDNGIQSFIGNTVTEIVQSETFAAVWTQANTIAHQQLDAALSGQDNGAVSVANNQVALNVGDLVAQVKTRLVDKGFTVAEKIPSVDATIVIFQSDSIGQVQAGYSLLNTIGFWLPFVALAIAFIGIAVANVRRVAFIGLGAGLTAAMFVAALALVVGRTAYLSALPNTVNQAVATDVFDTVTYFLRQAMWAGVVAGVVLILGGILLGPTRFARGVRSLADRAAGAIQRTLASWGATMTTVRTWVAARASGLRIAATVAAIAVIVLQRYKTPSLILWTTAGLLVVLFVIQIFASGVDEERPEVDAGVADEPNATAPSA